MKISRETITPTDVALLKEAKPRLDGLFWESVWNQSEAEHIARSVINACLLTYEAHGDPFCWLNETTAAWSGNGLWDGPRAMTALLKAHLVIEDAPAGLTPPDRTAMKNGKPQILRMNRILLEYLEQELRKKAA